jgi:hypothetical protein
MTSARKLFIGSQFLLFAGPAFLILLIFVFADPTVDPSMERQWKSLGSEPPTNRDIWLLAAFLLLGVCWLLGIVIGLLAWRTESKLGRRIFG